MVGGGSIGVVHVWSWTGDVTRESSKSSTKDDLLQFKSTSKSCNSAMVNLIGAAS